MTMTKKKRPLWSPINPYRKNNKEMLSVQIPKGKREAYKMAAQEFCMSLSTLIQNSVEEYIKNHGKEFIAEYEDKKTPDE